MTIKRADDHMVLDEVILMALTMTIVNLAMRSLGMTPEKAPSVFWGCLGHVLSEAQVTDTDDIADIYAKHKETLDGVKEIAEAAAMLAEDWLVEQVSRVKTEENFADADVAGHA